MQFDDEISLNFVWGPHSKFQYLTFTGCLMLTYFRYIHSLKFEGVAIVVRDAIYNPPEPCIHSNCFHMIVQSHISPPLPVLDNAANDPFAFIARLEGCYQVFELVLSL